jgi:hypothetical protein
MRPFILTGLVLAAVGSAAPVKAQYPYASPINNLAPVYRMFNGQNGDHLYTSDVNEANIIPIQGYLNEGIAFYVSRGAGPGMVPLYRFYLPNGTHALSTSPQGGGCGVHPARDHRGVYLA